MSQKLNNFFPEQWNSNLILNFKKNNYLDKFQSIGFQISSNRVWEPNKTNTIHKIEGISSRRKLLSSRLFQVDLHLRLKGRMLSILPETLGRKEPDTIYGSQCKCHCNLQILSFFTLKPSLESEGIIKKRV